MSFTLMRGDLGWALIPPARRWHFYVEGGRSACKKNDATGTIASEAASGVASGSDLSAFTPPSGEELPNPDDCTACWEKLNHRPEEPSG